MMVSEKFKLNSQNKKKPAQSYHTIMASSIAISPSENGGETIGASFRSKQIS